MKTKTPCVVVTFHTTADAMATEKLCAARGLTGRLISAPRSVSADCGIAWRSPVELGPAVRAALEEAGVEFAGFREMTL